MTTLYLERSTHQYFKSLIDALRYENTSLKYSRDRHMNNVDKEALQISILKQHFVMCRWIDIHLSRRVPVMITC